MKIKIKGFSIILRMSTILIFLLMIALGYIEQFFIIYIFIILHEIIHILTAYLFGCRCRKVTIMPVGLCAEIEDIENIRLIKRYGVIAAAPLFNIIVGFIFIKSFIGVGNIAIGIFNLLPVYPLDGARLFQNTLGYFEGTLSANKKLDAISRTATFIIFIAGIIQLILFNFNFTLIVIALYLYKEGKRFNINIAYYFYKCLVKSKNNNILKVRFIRADESISIKKLVYKFGIDYYTVVYIKDKILNEDMIREYIGKYGISGNIIDILSD